MKTLSATIKDFFHKRPERVVDPVYEFFFKTSSGERKKIYSKALEKTQADQEIISKIAKEKVRV